MIKAGRCSGSSNHIDLPCAKGILQNKMPTKRVLGDCSTRKVITRVGPIIRNRNRPSMVIPSMVITGGFLRLIIVVLKI